jgi:hypothetical protein
MLQSLVVCEGLPMSNYRYIQPYYSLLYSLQGVEVTIKTLDSNEITGLFFTATPFESSKGADFVVKAAKFKNAVPNCPNGSTAIVNADKILSIDVHGLDLKAQQRGNITGDLQTDAEIGHKTRLEGSALQSLQGRELANIDSSWLAPATSLSADLSVKKGGNTSWDQFEVNKRLYNVNSSFDESKYTTVLNTKDFTPEQIEMAERYAREIEGSSSSNVHLQEERGQVLLREVDEEDLYSGVIRDPSTHAATSASTPAPSKPGRGSSGASTGASVPKISTGINAPSWRKVVTGEPPSPVKGASSSSVPGRDSGKASAPRKGRPTALPPGYHDTDYVPVEEPSKAPSSSSSPAISSAENKSEAHTTATPAPADEKEKSSSSTSTSTTTTTSSAGAGAESTTAAASTSSTLSVAPVTPAEEKKSAESSGTSTSTETAPATASKLNVNAKEFVFKPKATAPAFVPGGASAASTLAPAYGNRPGYYGGASPFASPAAYGPPAYGAPMMVAPVPGQYFDYNGAPVMAPMGMPGMMPPMYLPGDPYGGGAMGFPPMMMPPPPTGFAPTGPDYYGNGAGSAGGYGGPGGGRGGGRGYGGRGRGSYNSNVAPSISTNAR